MVDDNAQILRALVAGLEHSGHRVIAAVSVRALMEDLGGQQPDLIISDYRLAGSETGCDVISAVRTAFDSAVPAIIITGDTDPALASRLESSCISVHYKPLRMDSLLAIINETTAGRDI